MMRKMKRTAQLAIVALLLSNAVPVAAQSRSSVEQALPSSSVSSIVNVTNQLNSSINKAVTMGFIKGDPDGKLRADDSITRQELAVVLAKALGLTTSKTVSSPFADVKSDSWSAPYIQAVKKAGLLQGDATGRFRPQAQITGQELVAVLVRATAFAKQGTEGDSVPQEWNGTSSWATPYVQLAIKADLLSEYPGETKVKQGLIRGEAVSMILSAMFPENRLSVIQQLQGDQVQINGVKYHISDNVAGLLNDHNRNVLDQAGIHFTSQNHNLTEINALEIRKGGEAAHTDEAEFSRNLLLNGGDTTLDGDLTIKADFTSVQGITIMGKLTIAPEMEHDFHAKNVKVEDSVLVQGGDSNTVVFEDSALENVNVDKSDVHVTLAGSTHAQEISVQSDSRIDIEQTATLPLLKIIEGASRVELQGTVNNVSLNTPNSMQLNGNVTVQQLTVDGAGPINIIATGTIQQLQVNNPAVQINVGGNVRVAEVNLAAGVPASAVSGGTGMASSNTPSPSSSGGTGGSETPVAANRAPELLKAFETRKFTANGQGATLNLTDYVTDPDGDPLTYTVASSKSSVAKVVLSGSNLEITPVEHGTATITVSSNDGRGKRLRSTFEVNVNAAPLATPIPDQELVAESGSKDVDLMIYFMDDEKYESELLYSVTNNASEIVGSEIVGSNYAESVLRLTPKKAGEVVLKIRVDDGQIADDGSAGVTEVEMRVVVLPPLNRAPVGDAPSNMDVYLGNNIPIVKLNELYTDPDGDPLTFSATSSDPDGLIVEENSGVLRFTALKFGEYTIHFSVEDGKGGFISTAFQVRVNSKPNASPVLTSNLPAQTLFLGKEDTFIDLSPYFSDPDGDALEFQTPLDFNNFLIAELNIQENKLTIHPKQVGKFQATIQAKDVYGKEATASIDIQVIESGSFGAIPNQTITWPWSTLDIDLTPYLLNFDISTLTVDAASTDVNIATVSANGAQVSVHPVAEGQATVTLTVYDLAGRKEQSSFNVTVQAEPSVNNSVPEVVSSIYEQVLTPNVTNARTYDLSQLFSDPDGDVLQYTISSSSAEAVDASINGNQLTIKPGTGNTVAPLTITAKDGKGGQVEYSFNVRTASLVNGGVIQINTKSGVQDALTYSTSSLFPGQTSFKVYRGTPDSTFTGPDTMNTNRIPLTVSPLNFWIIGNDGRAVVVQVNSLPQGTPELFFSQYVDAGDGRGVVQLYYTGDGDPSHKATGYQVEVYKWMKKTSTMQVTPYSVFDVNPGIPYIYIDTIFYDFFDITNASYYNDELNLYNPNEYNVVALVLKKDGRIVDVLGDPISHDQFMPAGGTFVRKRGIYTGSQQFSLTGEWNEYPKGTLQFVPYHTP